MAKKTLSDLEKRLGQIFKNAPNLPSDIKDLIVDYGPYLALIGGIMGLLSGFVFKLYTGVFSPTYALTGLFLWNYYLQTILNLVASVIMIVSFKPLKEKEYRGWQMLFYLTLIYAVFAIFSLSLAGLVGVILSFYLLFQIRGKYR